MTVTPVAIPDVWDGPATGLPWCDCGDDHPLTEATVSEVAVDLYGDLPDRLTHAQVVAVACEVWLLEQPCRFLLMQVEDAAKDVNGTVAADYPVRVGLAIVKRFSDRWNGCPEEACSA